MDFLEIARILAITFWTIVGFFSLLGTMMVVSDYFPNKHRYPRNCWQKWFSYSVLVVIILIILIGTGLLLFQQPSAQ